METNSRLENINEGCYAGYEDWLNSTADCVTMSRVEYDRLMSKISRLESELLTKDADVEFKRAEWK